MQSRKMTGRRRMGKGMRNGAGAKVITLMMILALLFSGIIGEVYAKDHEYSSVTSMTGGGDFQVGDRFQVRVSYTNGNGQNIAGMMARIAFPRRVLAYESTTLGPGSIDGYPEGYGSNLQNADRINQNGVFTLGLYNRDTVPALSATITFVAIAEGEGEITSTIGTYERAGWIDEDAIWAFLLRDDIELDRIRWELKTGLTGIELPEYFSPTLVRIDEMQVAAWKYEGGFGDGEYLLYGVNDEGARSFYRYDTGEEVVELWDPWEMRSLEGPQNNSSENDRERTGIYLTAAVGVLILVVVSVAVYQKQMEKKKKIKGRKKRK